MWDLLKDGDVMKIDNKYEYSFFELSENELVNTKAGGLGLCILGVIGGGITGAIGGAAATLPYPAAGAIVGSMGLGLKMGIEGWKK